MEILLISGLSGAGKSSVATYLEDIGYFTVDNVPPDNVQKFAEFCAESDGRYDRVALVSDARSGGNRMDALLEAREYLNRTGTRCRLLFLDADVQTIIKRYKETRRRHPLMQSGETIEEAVAAEAELLHALREHADVYIDTTQMPSAKLRSEIYSQFGDRENREKLNINVMSFGFKYGIPLEADLVFDVRFLPNPFYIPELREKSGLDTEVYDYVFRFEQTKTFMEQLEKMISYLLPYYSEEGKTMLVIAIGCTGGRHRSVAFARALSGYLNKIGYPTFENHRDVTRG